MGSLGELHKGAGVGWCLLMRKQTVDAMFTIFSLEIFYTIS